LSKNKIKSVKLGGFGIIEIEGSSSSKRGEMVAIPVFYGEDKADPEAYLREFKKACMANGDRDVATWLQLFPDFLEEAASRWYERQSPSVKSSWEVLIKTFVAEFQSKESYLSLLGSLGSVCQSPGESVRSYSERVRKLQSSIEKSVSRGGRVGTSSAPTDLSATLLGIGNLVLKSFVYGLLPALQEVVTFTDPPTFDEALALAQRKEDSLLCMAQPPISLLHSVGLTTTAPPVHPQHKVTTPTAAAPVQKVEADLTQLVNDMKDLKLFVLQSQGVGSRGQNWDTKRQVPPYVTCHGCGGRGHLKHECPDILKKGTTNSAEAKGKVVEIALLECKGEDETDDRLEVMMAKRDRIMEDIVSAHQARKKRHMDPHASISRGRCHIPRRKIGVSDLLLSRGQPDYSLAAELGKQNANITFGQLIAKCPALRREMRASVSTRKRKEVAAMDAFMMKKRGSDERSPQVEALINGTLVRGCMLDGGAAVNVMSSWFMNELGITPDRKSIVRLKAVDQRSVRSLGVISGLPVSVNGVSVKLDFQVLDINEGGGGYPIILGRPWLRKVRAVSFWENGQMKIGPRLQRVNIEVIPQDSETSERTDAPENESDFLSETSWSSATSSESDYTSEEESEVEVFGLEALPQPIGRAPLTSNAVQHVNPEELLSKVKFGPTLNPEERRGFEDLVMEFSHLFVTKHGGPACYNCGAAPHRPS
jgi:hypothetical protein